MTAQPVPLRRPTFGLLIGSKLIVDILNPQPEELDLPEIDRRLTLAHRFSNNPEALTIAAHQEFTANMAKLTGEPEEVIWWCSRHDRHEGIIGDIPGPLCALIRTETNILEIVKTRLDIALCEAEGRAYPSHEVRAKVHVYDKAAETVEWRVILGQPERPWNVSLTQEELQQWGAVALCHKHGMVPD